MDTDQSNEQRTSKTPGHSWVSPGRRRELEEDGDLGASNVVEGQELFEQAQG